MAKQIEIILKIFIYKIKKHTKYQIQLNQYPNDTIQCHAMTNQKKTHKIKGMQLDCVIGREKGLPQYIPK